MNDDLALAFLASPEPWVTRWRRHVTDHGPGHVVDVIAEARTVMDQPWRILLAAADHPLLTADLVDMLHHDRRGVVAVFDPADPRAKARALEAGADALVECDATPEELERVLAEVIAARPAPRVAASRRRTAPPLAPVPGAQLVAVGGPPGSPAVEVALALAWTLDGRRHQSAVVVDVDETTPSVAQMTGLPTLPNLASAVAARRADAPVADHLATASGGLAVLAGLADPGQWADLSPAGVRSVLTVLTADHIVAVVGPVLEAGRGDRYGLSRSVLADAAVIVAVGAATPVGIARLAHWCAAARGASPRAALWLVAAGVGRSRYRRGEVAAALDDLGGLPGIRAAGSTVLALGLRRAERAAWDGGIIRGGAFASAVKRLSREVCP